MADSRPMLFTVEVDTKTGEVSLRRFTGAVNEAARNTEKPVQSLSAIFGQLKGSAEKVGQTMETIVSPKMLMGALGIGAAVAATKSLASGFIDLVKEGQRVANIAVGFKQLSKDAGVDGVAALDALKTATGGVVDDEILMSAMNRVLMRDFKLTQAQMEELANVAIKMGKSFGKDAATSLDDFAEAVSRGNPRMLKKIGIMIDAEKALDDYAKSIGLVSTLLDEDQKRQAILNASLEYGRKKVGDMAYSYDTLGASIKAAETRWKDLKDTMGALLSEGIRKDAFNPPAVFEVDPKQVTDFEKKWWTALGQVLNSRTTGIPGADLALYLFGPHQSQRDKFEAYLKAMGMTPEGIHTFFEQRSKPPFEIKIPESQTSKDLNLRKVAGLLPPEDVERQLQAFDLVIQATERLRASQKQSSLEYQIYTGQIEEQSKKKRQILIDLGVLVDPEKMAAAKKELDDVILSTDKKIAAFFADINTKGKQSVELWQKQVIAGEETGLRSVGNKATNFRVPIKFVGWWDQKEEERKAAEIAQDLADKGLIPGSSQVNFGALGAPSFIKDMRPAQVDNEAKQLAGAQEQLNKWWDEGTITAKGYYDALMQIGDAWERLLGLGIKLLPQDAERAKATKKVTDAKKWEAEAVQMVAGAFASEASAAWSAYVAGDAAGLSARKVIRSIADMAGVKALWEVAEGIADYATHNYADGTTHMIAAAKYAAVAGVALAVAGRGEGTATGGGGGGGGGTGEGGGMGGGYPLASPWGSVQRDKLLATEMNPSYAALPGYANPYLEPGSARDGASMPSQPREPVVIHVHTMDAKSFREWASQPGNRTTIRELAE